MILLYISGGIIAAVLITVLLRDLLSGHTPAIPGAVKPVTELKPLRVGGVDQWLLIRGEDRDNPVLLFLHGGPGTAMIGLFRHYQKLLEQHFVVVQWDQRGAGLSGMKPVDPATLTREQYVSDGVEVARYLFERFGNRKIYLVGHSWGSGLGYIMAHRHPELFSMFFGINQMSRDTEPACYAETLKRAREENNEPAVKALEALGPPPYKNVASSKSSVARVEEGKDDVAGMLERYRWSAALGGDYRGVNVEKLFIRDLLLSREYSLKVSLRWMKNKSFSINNAYGECNRDVDLFAEGTDFAIPMFFFLGTYDLLTVPSGAEELMDVLSAPEKGIVRFDAAHEIPWECTEEYQKAIIEKTGIA